MKPSQNLYTELILRTLGKMRKGAPPPDETRRASQTDEDAGFAAVRDFLKQAGVSDSQMDLDDGSGLSRSDMIMADATVQLLTFMTKHRYFAQFRDALPMAGVDGTCAIECAARPPRETCAPRRERSVRLRRWAGT